MNSYSSFCCAQYENFQSSVPLHQTNTRNTTITWGMCSLNGTFPPLSDIPTSSTHLAFEVVHATWQHSTAVQAVGGILPEQPAGWQLGFLFFAWCKIYMDTRTKNCIWCSTPARWSHPFLAPCAALSTVQNRSRSKISLRMLEGQRTLIFFPMRN